MAVNEGRKGYKKTELGWIPKEWDLRKLGTFGNFSKGKGISKNELIEIGIPCIRYGEIYTTHDYVIKNFYSFISPESAKESKQIQKNDILFAGSGETLEDIGKSVAFIDAVKAYAGGDVIILHPQNVDSVFLAYALNNEYVVRQKRRFGQGYSVVHIYSKELKELLIITPSLFEQKKIAEILGTWDKAIELTEKLIQAKTQLKKGLMQQLLTGKRRFGEFVEGKILKNTKIGKIPNKWKLRHLEECAEILFSNVDKKTNKKEKPVLLCNYTDVYYNDYITSILNFMNATATSAEIDKYTLKKGDVIITKDSETPDDIAVPAFVSEDLKNVICGYHLALIRPDRNILLGEYLSKLLQLQIYRYYFFTLANGVTRFGLTTKATLQALISLPSLEEQKKIAAVLSACDKEIDLLTQKLDALKTQKKGLMQKLLTGQVRVNHMI
jgi:type I restriction enzyme S subunit